MKQYKTILVIESSCDETAAAVIRGSEQRVQLLSNVVASSADLQAKYGGVIPEQAAREQLKSIIPVIESAINDSGLRIDDIEAIAVTQGPGLIGSLLVGVETAKTLALVWNKPLVPINHLIGHFYANWVVQNQKLRIKNKASQPLIPNSRSFILPIFPIIGLLVSGGHTDLILMKDHGKYDYLGGTRDDAAGECFDKCARLLNLPYPGGPQLSKLAETGDPKAYKLPRPMLDSHDFDFSFSGLKTAVNNLVNKSPKLLKEPGSLMLSDLAASIQASIVELLVRKTVAAAQRYNIDQIMVAGGVAANSCLREELKKAFHGQVFIPSPNFCTDNAAMIAAAAYYNYNPQGPLSIQANPNLSL